MNQSYALDTSTSHTALSLVLLSRKVEPFQRYSTELNLVFTANVFSFDHVWRIFFKCILITERSDSTETGTNFFVVHSSLFKDLLEYCYGEESTSAVDDMLREKYMYGAEEVPIQLMNDLRIERLRREYKQSQL